MRSKTDNLTGYRDILLRRLSDGDPWAVLLVSSQIGELTPILTWYDLFQVSGEDLEVSNARRNNCQHEKLTIVSC